VPLDFAGAVSQSLTIGQLSEHQVSLYSETIEHSQPGLKGLIPHRDRRIADERLRVYIHSKVQVIEFQ
jgi:hypothetical protein